MHVKVVSITKNLVQEAAMNAEELLVYIARVSNPSNQLNSETADKLIAYLIKNKHWSPFDMVNMCVEVKTSKAIAIQILRHWSIKPQEFSQRYAEVTEIEPIHLRKAAISNRQSSEDRFDPMINFHEKPVRASEAVDKIMAECQELYKALLHHGVAKECARMILPMATSTVLYLNGSVRSWIHYLEQRTDVHAQLEHREVAQEIKRIFGTYFPNIIKAIDNAQSK